MKTDLLVIFSLLFAAHASADAISDELTSSIESNDLVGIVNIIDSASDASVSLSQMLADAETALSNTTDPSYNNAARRYLYDFSLRPMIASAARDVLYVDPSLFTAGQIGAGKDVIITPDRIILPLLQSAMSYLGYVRGGQWTVISNEAFYNENVTIPPGQAITWTGIGGVVIGNGGADQFSSTVARTVTWQLNDSENVAGVTPSLILQATPFGDGGYRNMPYMSNTLIGNYFVTQITGSITSSPHLEFNSVYLWGGMGFPTPTDIGPVNIVARNVRSGGALNFASANLSTLQTSSIIPPITCTSLGDMTDDLLYDAITASSMTGSLNDCFFGQTGKEFSILLAPKVLNLNVSTNYWWHQKTWSVNPGTTVQVINE